MDRPREPLPTRVQDTPTLPAAYDDALGRGPRRARPGPDAGGAGRDRRSRPPAARLDRGDQPDRDPRARPPWPPPTSSTSLSGLAVLRERGADRWIDLGLGRRLSGPPAGGRLPGRPCPAARAHRQEGPLPVGRLRGHGPRRHGRGRAGPRRGAGGRSTPSRPLAGRRRRAPSRHSPSWSSWPSRCSRPAAASSPGSAARSRTSWPPRTGRSPRSAAGRSTSATCPSPGLDGHRLVVVTARGGAPDDYPRDPGTRRRRPW